MNMKDKQGFTLLEVSAAMTLLVMTLALTLSGYMFSLKNINQGDVQNQLDMNVQLAMERLKKDLRLSSLDSMFYYPAGAGPYEAISFCMAEDTDGDGILEKNSEGLIDWDETVIYHIRPTTPNQLVKTTFKPRDTSLTDAQRQAQLESVVKFGHGGSTYNANHAKSKTIFANLLDWEILPKGGSYDAYAPVLTRESASLGYILLDPGTHAFTFRVKDKNSSSSGYKVGIDQLFVSPSYSEREAEAQLPVATQSGATAIAQYMPGDWKGNHQLYFPATAPGDTFTLKLNNDQWEETNFGAVGYEANDTEALFDKTISPQDFVVQLKGNDITWEASEQTGSIVQTSTTNGLLSDAVIAVHINGSELGTNGNWIAYSGRKCRLTFQAGKTGHLQVDEVYFGKTGSDETTAYGFSGTPARVGFSGSSSSPIMAAGTLATSDWIDYKINATNNYLVVFHIKNDPNTCYPAAWNNLRTSIPDCVVNGQPTNAVLALRSITASYPETGTYASQVFDTHLIKPAYNDLRWNALVPSGTALGMKVRSGNLPDLSDAPAWDTLAASSVNPRSTGVGYSRYVQFQAVMQSDTTGLRTPKLTDVTIDWRGERQLVNISGIFTKGPDYGMIEVLVNGDPLRAALVVDLEIYKDVRVMNKETRRVTSALQVELTPRNSEK